MDKLFVFMAIAIILIIAGGSLYYFNRDNSSIINNSTNQPNGFGTLFLQFQNNSGDIIAVPFTLYVNDVAFLIDKSSDLGYSKISVPVNSTFYIKTESLEYYNKKIYPSFQFNSLESKTIDGILETPGKISITKEGQLKFSDNLFLNISIDGYLNKPLICFRWSPRIIKVEALYKNQTEIPERLKKKVDSCYLISDYINESVKIPIQQHKVEQLTDQDYIRVYVIDDDEYLKGVDSMSPDYLYTIDS